jgi:predicted nucleic acid-binding protein
MPDCLLDTNVLIYLVSVGAPEHVAATSAVGRILASGAKAVIAAQSIYEFWSVATRPVTANGLGWTVERTRSTVETLLARFPILSEPPEVVGIWIGIVVERGVKGKRVHDAHLLATMKANGVSHLLTFNASDFPAMDDLAILPPVC